MSRLVNAAALAGLVTLISAAAGAQGASDNVLPLGQTATDAPKWLSTTTESGLYLGPNGFSRGARSETSVKLGDGLSAGIFSSLSTPPAGAATNGLGGRSLTDPVGHLQTGFYSASNGAPGYGLNPLTGNPAASTFGGRVSQDLGGGLSVNFVGGVTRDTANGYYLGPRGSLNMNPGSDVSASFGGGMSMDFGGGSSLSISGTMSKGSAGAFSMGRCNGLTAGGFCR